MTEIYLIECAAIVNGRPHTWFAERDCDRLLKQNTIDDIAGRQIENVVRVYAANVEENSFQDVTQEIAQDIIDQLDHEPTGDLFDFLESTLGCRAMAELGREAWGQNAQFGAGA